ncbi:heme exporter protein CcmB [Terricaulis silvestris]|uniref:Heme exporter protein B n=1 Tax=Terricaulis silvestris TaxID=2686094 RepID=A0A6I6MRX5_9CAUL|nr:heme exporter protein CcmB [Terricaulis silvestris]QGZ95374.1 Cytochrome c-type biogenesis protein CcmB [Terricaulis silvestris]
MSALGVTFRREIALMWSGGGVLAPLGFFLGATMLVPLAMGPERALLQSAGPPLVWIAAALAVLATLERLFQADLEDGSLDQMLLSHESLEGLVLAKGAALWCAVGLPLSLAAAPAAIALQAPVALVPAIVLSLMLGTAAFIGVGLIGAAVTAGVKRGGVLIALIVLPFFAPPIIFGAAVAGGEQVQGALLVLAGIALGAAALGPIAAAAALRLQAE